MSQGNWWIVACTGADQREVIYSILKSRVTKGQLCNETAVFEVPLNLKFGSFDDLIRLVDELGKHDATCEAILRRIERQALEIDPTAEFKIIWQRNAMTVDHYIRHFAWDDAKYQRARQIRDNVKLLIDTVTNLDSEVRVKTTTFNELRSQHVVSSGPKRDGLNLMQKNLIDVLTPEKVSKDDFLETEHITTRVVVIPRGLDKEWLSCYETLENFVVPRSSKKFDVTDRDLNTLWSLMLFRSSVEAFRVAARQRRFVLRDFVYSEDDYKRHVENWTKLEAEKSRQETFLTRVCFAAFSECFISWVHLKAMRIFVEAVLRFGVPPNFSAFFIKPTSSSKEKKLRKELGDVFAPPGSYGRNFSSSGGGGPSTAHEQLADALDSEEFYPYVSLYLTPFLQAVQK